MEDKDIVDLYWAREESAIRETEKKYGRYCHYVASRILQSDEDAEEVVNDTYLRAWNSIPPSRPTQLKAYLAKIASRLSLDRYDARSAEKRGGGELPLVLEELAECVPSGEGEHLADEITLRDAVNRFLWSLPVESRRIFVRRYWYASSVAEIAREYGMKESAVGMLLLRTRAKLKHELNKEGILL
jgi:RNA polymerase sigma-70 factor (ECF subfamily)